MTGITPGSLDDASAVHGEPRFRDADARVAERVEDLLGRMTLEEKAGQLTQYFFMKMDVNLPADFDLASVPEEHRKFLDQPRVVEEAVRAGTTGSVLFVKRARETNRLQQIAVEESRLGIPLLVGFDVVHGLRTTFPVPIALAASWSPQTAEASQRVAAREARAVGIRWTFAPMIDIARDPRWGRVVEGAGEDPHLGAEMAAAQVRGFQGGAGATGVLAGPKHFAGYGAGRGGRDYDDVEISDAEFHNVYLPPFRAAIDAGAANIMTAYMDLNGVPASANRWLLRDVLRDELGFEGFTVSDANAVRSLTVQHFARDLIDAAVRAVEAGLDLEMCMFDPAYAHLPDAVAQGRTSESVVDEAVRRILTAKFELGLFERPYVDEAVVDDILGDPLHRIAAREAAEQSFVLLENRRGTLPLRPRDLGSIAVIGQLAASKRDTLGPWVFDADVSETVTVLDGLRDRLGPDVRIDHLPGVGLPERTFPSAFDRMETDLDVTPADHDDDHELARAVSAVADADLAVVVVGQRQNEIGENASVSTLELSGRQSEQLRRVTETGTPVVVLVMSGRPVDLSWAAEHAAAVLQVWYPGVRGGEAVARVLVGDSSPAGRLPFTWPRSVGQVPMIASHLRTFQPENQGLRYNDEPSTPLWRFGHGLSYGSFAYGPPLLERTTVALGEDVVVSVEVTNTSDRDVDEVVQLFTHQRHGAASRPVQELKGFRRVSFGAGETRTVRFTLPASQLRYWSAASRTWVQDRTEIEVWFGVERDRAAVLDVI